MWAEARPEEIDDGQADIGARAVQLQEAAGPVNATLGPAIRGIASDAVLQRSERCQNGSGLELRRRLFLEMRGAAPQVAMVQAEQYTFPPRVGSIGKLWDGLQRWLALGSEVEGAGYECPEWTRSAALLRLVPAEMEKEIVARPELSTYPARLAWIKAQLAHLRANLQAAAISSSRDDAMVIGALGEESAEATMETEPMLARLEALEQMIR